MSNQIIIDARLEGPVATWVVTKPDGQQIRKKGRIDQFIGLLQTSCTVNNYQRVGKLPHGLLDFAIGDVPGTFKAILKVPAGIRSLQYHSEPFMVPFPETVFLLTSVSGRLVFSQVFASENGNVYHYPFGNVYPDGKICWGRNSLPEIRSLLDMQKIPILFYGSDTNDDLYTAGRSVIKRSEFAHQRGLIKNLEKETEFPSQWLVPIGKDSFSKLIDNFMDNGMY